MRVWITKYALTTGIFEADVDVSDDFPELVRVSPTQYFQGEGKDWHRTKIEALQRAEEMRQKKIRSLKKQIEKLKKKTFD